MTTAGSLAAAALVAVAVTVVGQLVAERLALPSPTASATRTAVTTALVVLACVPLVASVLLVRTARWHRAGTVLSGATLSGVVTVVLAVPLGGSPLYLNGVTVDQEFRTQLLTRLTDSAALSDMNYADLSSFYPAGWFWLGGRVGNLLGLDGWEVFKPYAIGSLAVAAAVSVVLWSRVVRADHAIAVATVSTLVAVSVGAPEPYGAVIAMVLAPVLVLAWTSLRGSGGWRHWLPGMVAAGVFLGVAAMFYTLYLGVSALALVVMAGVAAVLVGRADGARAGLATLLRLVPAALVAVVLGLVVWAPYLLDRARGGATSGVAQRYLPDYGAQLLLPMTQPSVLGALCLVGTVWLAVSAHRSSIAQALGIGVLCIYLWSLLSLLAVLADTTLLGFRLGVPLEVLLASAGALGTLEWVSAGARLLHRRRGELLRPAVTVVVAVSLVGVVALAQSIPGVLSREVNLAYTDPDAQGVRADGQSGGDATSYPQIDSVITTQSGRPAPQVVVLTTEYRMLSFYPYRSFQMLAPHYANPLGNFPARSAEVERWAKAPTAAELVRMLDASPWAPPTAFVLRDLGDSYAVQLSTDTYPNNPNVTFYSVLFPKRLFDDPAFRTTAVGPFAVVVRTG
ncbi:arabinofuranosyltransferase [Rhodococcus sp. X156]|uniref:arabinofuranosyltransferase n=1 Tax=Rhodococcus sp. X156 TaxID=2499145 RepID=UPI0024087774|nr:arabinofuranosyltransferase [Rhodococcus sp. X156]